MLGVIGGSGFAADGWLQATELLSASNRYGSPSAALQKGPVAGRAANTICFLPRHGDGSIPPHKVNYRANVQALCDAGVTTVISVNAVGACDTTLQPVIWYYPTRLLIIAGVESTPLSTSCRAWNLLSTSLNHLHPA